MLPLLQPPLNPFFSPLFYADPVSLTNSTRIWHIIHLPSDRYYLRRAGTGCVCAIVISTLLIFGFLGPIIRRKCPDGFVLTEWTRHRYGAVAGLFLSICTLITIFLYMVAELSALQQIITALTGLDGLPAVIVQCVVTTIYTCRTTNTEGKGPTNE